MHAVSAPTAAVWQALGVTWPVVVLTSRPVGSTWRLVDPAARVVDRA
jgi:hypothetical protein